MRKTFWTTTRKSRLALTLNARRGGWHCLITTGRGSSLSRRKRRTHPETEMKRLAPWVSAFGHKARKQASRKPLQARQRAGRIRPVSRQREGLMRAYRAKSARWLAGKRCFQCFDKQISVHHTRGRVGTLLCDERFWLALCDHCHRWVHDNPEEARSVGLLCQPGEWGKQS